MLVYVITILISASLLFLVQPLIGRYILPWFGGSSAVWSAAQLFFQLLLLAGYGYSRLVVSRLARRRQAWVHGALLLLTLSLMAVNLTSWSTPITPGDAWSPRSDRAPLLQILATLAVSVGLPYFLLSTTSPLVQAWFTARFPDRSPYPLYAVSNAGSILALLAYPLLMEPALAVPAQAAVWSWGFLLFGLCLAAILVSLLRSRPSSLVEAADYEAVRSPAPWWHPLLWLGFSACGSTILLGATNQMTQNVAAVPLLWVVPLALYLLTFVIAFAADRTMSRWSIGLFLIAMPLLRTALVRANALPIFVQLGTYALVVFAGCMVCHSEMARLRPRAGDLTAFYFVISAGGVLGGLFVNLLAPQIFADFWELVVGVALCWGLAVAALSAERDLVPQRSMNRYAWSVFWAIVGLLYALSTVHASIAAFNRATLDATRNFYGTQRVQTMSLGEDASDEAYRLVHGTTVHGVQYVDPALRRKPIGYYCASSGIGLVMSQSASYRVGQKIAVLGLGAGTLAAYGRPGDEMMFYEIDPQVVDYAEGQGGYFSYLEDSAAEIGLVIGDARLSLERELASKQLHTYDVMVVDVFSGDAPPVHLLTREALDIYLAHLAPDGLLAMNVSTTHVDLERIITGLAQDAGLYGVVVEDAGDGKACFPSRWVVMARRSTSLPETVWSPYPRLQEAFDPTLRLWTDAYSNLLQILHRP